MVARQFFRVHFFFRDPPDEVQKFWPVSKVTRVKAGTFPWTSWYGPQIFFFTIGRYQQKQSEREIWFGMSGMRFPAPKAILIEIEIEVILSLNFSPLRGQQVPCIFYIAVFTCNKGPDTDQRNVAAKYYKMRLHKCIVMAK